MKKLLFIPLLLIAAVAVIVASVKFSTYLTAGETSIENCDGNPATHQVTIQNGMVSPQHIDGRLCDKLTITNGDDQLREMAFGKHDEHVTYDGVTEEVLKQGQQLSVELIQTGSFIFHDHLDEAVKGSFTVTR